MRRFQSSIIQSAIETSDLMPDGKQATWWLPESYQTTLVHSSGLELKIWVQISVVQFTVQYHGVCLTAVELSFLICEMGLILISVLSESFMRIKLSSGHTYVLGTVKMRPKCVLFRLF